MTIQERIELNRKKNARWDKYERVLRRVRLKVFDYEDAGKLDKAHRVIAKCKAILMPRWQARHDTVMAARLQNYMM